jgi:carbon monoxide dehydrogenase subunit G
MQALPIATATKCYYFNPSPRKQEMILSQRLSLPVEPERVWDFMMDMPAVSRCVPGIDAMQQIHEDSYTGALNVRVGPISIRLEGRVAVTERNKGEWRARIELDAADPHIEGAVNAKSTMQLEPRADKGTDLVIRTDASVLGKLGEFGQPIIRRKVDQIMTEFARNMARELASTAASFKD